jgi:hypothetical protein
MSPGYTATVFIKRIIQVTEIESIVKPSRIANDFTGRPGAGNWVARRYSSRNFPPPAVNLSIRNNKLAGLRANSKTKTTYCAPQGSIGLLMPLLVSL